MEQKGGIPGVKYVYKYPTGKKTPEEFIRTCKKMNDEEFKKKLESILGNFYRIDQEAKNYLDAKRLHRENQDYKKPFEKEGPTTDEKYKT